jgi:4-amino-4-deoxy-L-arabinose transferase-like glycosyltransferase
VVAAGVPALLPMVPFISAEAGPDGMLYGLWALALWLGVRIIRRGPDLGSGIALGTVVGAACVTKTTSYALLPAMAIAVAVAAWRHRGDRSPGQLAVWGLAGVAPLIVFLGGWALLARSLDRPAVSQLTGATVDAGGTNWRQLASYLWQYYLPRLPGQEPFKFNQTGYPAFQIWIKQGWAAFGWLEVRFSDAVYRVLAILTLIAGAGAAAAVVRAWRRIDWAVAAYLATAAGALLAGLHWTDYRFIEGGNAFIQGRYLFPILPILAVGLAAAIGLARGRGRAWLAGGVLAFLFAFHVAALGLVVDRFYA